jgi:hypothetical protein
MAAHACIRIDKIRIRVRNIVLLDKREEPLPHQWSAQARVIPNPASIAHGQFGFYQFKVKA